VTATIVSLRRSAIAARRSLGERLRSPADTKGR
jgi:hypothetical protein